MTRSLGLIVWLFERHMKVTPNPTLDGLPITKEEYDRARPLIEAIYDADIARLFLRFNSKKRPTKRTLDSV